ncbi:ATP-binding protein [Roseibium sp. SCP14]|uniref:ATP-binding protein n=1 Tax=Roseibium sp. SCP14 TaxID=3141375 RepID=UPI0033393E55
MIKRFWPETMRNQILVLMICASLFMILVGVVTLYFVKQAFEGNPTIMNSHFVSVAVTKLNETPAEDRGAVLIELSKELPQLKIELVDEEVLTTAKSTTEGKRSGPFALGETVFGMRIEHVIGPLERGFEPPLVYMRLSDDSIVAAEWGLRPPPASIIGLPFYLFFGFLALTFLGLMIWAAKGLVRPLSELAASAKTFGESSVNPIPIREQGPREVRVAAQAFNRMQHRINDFLEKRTRMLAAISHDLRTPLTRLRLRLDLLEDGDIRNRSLEDLNVMEEQIDAALTFLRDGSGSGPVQRIDVASLLQSLSDQYSDLGFSVKLRCLGSATIEACSSEITRALSNLVDNAVQYASGVEIDFAGEHHAARIEIIDHGPGIPASERARLLEPFERGDAARQIRKGTGFGLGLATSKAIVEAASGTLELQDTPGGGLTVRLVFPVA